MCLTLQPAYQTANRGKTSGLHVLFPYPLCLGNVFSACGFIEYFPQLLSASVSLGIALSKSAASCAEDVRSKCVEQREEETELSVEHLRNL